MLKTEQILNAKFTPVSKGTYSAEEVDAFLKAVAQSYDQLTNEKNELIKKISILADKIESYRNDEEAIKLSLLDAHRMAETIGKNATIKSDTLIGDAETRAQLIVDGANRQATKTIDEAKEEAKGIVENAKTAVASLTERAQKETDEAVATARAKAAVIVSDAKDEAERIVSASKEAYEFYTSELKRIQTVTSEFKATIKVLCNNQLAVAESIPDSIAIPLAYEGTKAEEVKEEAVVEAEETEITIDSEDIIAELDEEIDVIENAADEIEAEEEIAEEIVEEAAVEEAAAEEEEIIVEDDDDEYIEIDDDEDLFSLIDDFDDMLTDSIPETLDDIVVAEPVAVETEAESEAEAEDDQEDVFEGFKIDLDSLGLDDNSDDDDDDITSLFDSMFDD